MRKFAFVLVPPLLAMHSNIAFSHAEANHTRAYFIAPRNGDKIAGPVTVKFGLQGYGVAPAGVIQEKTGHHHLLINVDQLPPLDQPLPKNDQVRHFGGGQTETSLELPKGRHTLQLVLGDGNHVPIGKEYISEKITIEVK